MKKEIHLLTIGKRESFKSTIGRIRWADCLKKAMVGKIIEKAAPYTYQKLKTILAIEGLCENCRVVHEVLRKQPPPKLIAFETVKK